MMDQIDIKALRERINWDQGRLARFLGMDRSSVSHMENGRAQRGPVKKLLQTLAAAADAGTADALCPALENQNTAEVGETETPPASAADAGEGEASRLNTSPVDHTGIPAFLRVGTPENQALRHGVKSDHVSPYRESGAVCPALGVGVDGFSVNSSTPSSDHTGGAAADE